MGSPTLFDFIPDDQLRIWVFVLFVINYKLTIMPTIFDNIQIPKPNRSVFDLSHEVKMSTNLGILTPFLCQEVLLAINSV